MPRPKRSKVAPSAPIPLPHLAKSAVASAAQKQRDIFSPASSGRVTTTSDDSDGLVVSKKTGARGKGLKGQEYTMSGALAPEDIGSTRLKPPSNQTRATLSKIAREADYAKKMAEAKAVRDVTQTEAAAELDQIPSSIPTESVVAPMPSGLGMGNSSAINGVQMGLGSRIGETPRQQLSILGATFKKRARQPSLLQMLQARNDPSDNLDDDDLDDFRPDDESTPVIKSMSQPDAQHTSSSSRQTSGSRKRKLATPEIQVPASQTRDLPSSPPVPPQDQEEVYDLPPEEDEVRPEPRLPQQNATRTPQRQLDSDTLAPPHSSSSPEEAKPRKIHAKTTKTTTRPQQQTKRKNQQPSSAPPPLSSHASATSANPSPLKPTTTLKPLTTATLQNLLPRRRVRPSKNTTRGEYDFPTSSDVELDNTALGEDEDELSFHATMKMRRRKKKKNDGSTTNSTAMQQKRTGKEREKGKGKEVPLNDKRVSRTYTKKTTTALVEPDDDVENADNYHFPEDEDEDENGGDGRGRSKSPALLDARAKDEMKRLAVKFREVDEYALDFEDLTGGNSSSQMRDAR